MDRARSVPADRRTTAALLAAMTVLPACGSTSYLTVLQVDPAGATLFINGKRVGTGDKRPYDLSFKEHDRVFLQATARGFVPQTQIFDAEGIANILRTTQPYKITLQQSR